MHTYSEDILLPSFQRYHRSQIEGKRTVVEITFLTKINPESEVIVPIPKTPIDPNTICLFATLKNANTKSWFKNNLGRLFSKKLMITFAGKIVYDNNCESLIMVYKDLWLPNKQREDMSKYGIANENLRKLMSGDDSASPSNISHTQGYQTWEKIKQISMSL